MFGGKRGGGAEAVLVAADQAMYRAKEEGRNRIALFQRPGRAAGATAAAARRPRARIRDALTHDRLSLAHPADPQPRLGRDRALRAAAADDRRERRAAAGRLLHRGGGALRDGPGARPLGRRPGPRAARPSASARASRSRCTSTSPAPRSTDLSVLEFIERRLDEGDADPAPLHLRDHRDGAGRTTTKPRRASPTASPSSAARSRSTTTAPASAPSTT